MSDNAPALAAVAHEYELARRKHPIELNSAHEGYAVLLEEVDELWQEIKHGTREAAQKEALQVGAVVLALLREVYNYK